MYGAHTWAYATPVKAGDAADADAVTFAAADAVSDTVIYNDENDGARSSDKTT